MSVRGIFTSHSGLLGERQNDLSARVLMIQAGGMAPLLALTSGMPTESVSQVSWAWIEDGHITGNATVVTGGNSAAVSIVVNDSNIWVPNSIIMNEVTGEHMLVTSVNADGITVGISRGWAGTTAATITAADTLQSIGTAYAEGSGRPDPVSQKGEERTNYVQIFKNGWAITGTAKAIKFLTGSQLARNRELCFMYHAEDIERAFWWGRKSMQVVGGKQLRTTNGVLAQIEGYGGLVQTANTGGVSGALSLLDLQTFMRKIFDFNAKGHQNERLAFCGSLLLELIQQMVMMDSTYNIETKETEFGIQVTTITGFNGRLKLISHPMMVENPIWQRELYVIHPGLITKRKLRDTWTEEFTAGKMNNNGIDADEGYIAIEMGLEVKGAKTMGIYRNIRTAAASF